MAISMKPELFLSFFAFFIHLVFIFLLSMKLALATTI